MDWKDVGEAVKKFAPLLGTAIGGPAGGAIGGAVSLALGAFGLGGDATPDDLMRAISADPQAALKLMEIQEANKMRLADLALQTDQAYLADRQDARKREVAITQATGKRDINLYILAWTVVVGFFVLVGVMMGVTLPEKNVGPINQLFGAMSVGFGTVLAYFFGSSQSSDLKTKLMAGK